MVDMSHIDAQGVVWFLFYMLVVGAFAVILGMKEDDDE